MTTDCDVVLASGQDEQLRATRSGHALILRGEGELGLQQDAYRFDGGTRIEGGTLTVGGGSTVLESDVRIGSGGTLVLVDQMRGDVDNRGRFQLLGVVNGDVRNTGRMDVSGAVYGNAMWITGNFLQSDAGVFAFHLAPAGWDSPAPLRIDGRAELAGNLELDVHHDGWGPYPLPEPRAHHLIHAGGGVAGRFEGWTSPGFAIGGSVRYGENDVWFDLARISVEASAAAASGSSLAVASASNLDRALEGADASARGPAASLDQARRSFLGSAASILWQPDTAQAMRSLDSIAGHAHAELPGMLHRDHARAAGRLGARLAQLAPGTGPVAWTADPPASTVAFGARASGLDVWLGPRSLVGGSISAGEAWPDFGRSGGTARGDAASAGLHVHYRGDGWHATGAVGTGRATLRLQRPIDLGVAGRHAALAERALVHAFAHGELGRDIALGGGRFMPMVALDWSSVRGDGFMEHGGTGFELVAGASRQTRLTAAVGARFIRDWTSGGRALRLQLDARLRDGLVDADPVRAAFRGVPEVRFDLPEARGSTGGEISVRLGADDGAGSRWWLDYAAGPGHDRGGWTFALERVF